MKEGVVGNDAQLLPDPSESSVSFSSCRHPMPSAPLESCLARVMFADGANDAALQVLELAEAGYSAERRHIGRIANRTGSKEIFASN